MAFIIRAQLEFHYTVLFLSVLILKAYHCELIAVMTKFPTVLNSVAKYSLCMFYELLDLEGGS